jgi:RNA recognition motif-containing protein
MTSGRPPPPSTGFGAGSGGGTNPGNQLYIGNVSGDSPVFSASCLMFSQLPYQAGWQDLKDLFRSAGNIVRADINIGPDGRGKGSGTVIFETPKDAQNAISKTAFGHV